MQTDPVPKPSSQASTLFLAGLLYTAFRDTFGNVHTFADRVIPPWEEVRNSNIQNSQDMKAQWSDVARAACVLPLEVVCDQPDPDIDLANPLVSKVAIQINEDKALRVRLDQAVQFLKTCDRKSPERTLAMRKLQEARFWLGMDLGEIAPESYPYPQGNDPTSPVVEPPADTAVL